MSTNADAILIQTIFFASLLLPWVQYYNLLKYKPLPNTVNYHLDNSRTLSLLFFSFNIIADIGLLYHHFKGHGTGTDAGMGHAFESIFIYGLKLIFLLFAEVQYSKFKTIYNKLKVKNPTL